MNYWETVAGQELLNLIKMEVSRYFVLFRAGPSMMKNLQSRRRKEI